SHYVVIWEFEVKATEIPAFEMTYRSEGDWAELFSQGEGFIRTDLVQDIELPTRYIALDYWQSRAHYLAFREAFNQPYDELDARCRDLTLKETLLGAFQVMVPSSIDALSEVSSC